MITETPLRHQCKQCVLQTPLHFLSLKCMCLIAVIWFKMLCALFFCISLSLSFSPSLPPGKPKSSIKKTTWGCPSLFWLFDQPYSTGATLHKKQYHVYALTKTITAVISATHTSTESASAISEVLQVSYHSAAAFIYIVYILY